VVLFFVACVYCVLEVHSSTDTWIGLAAGRQILESGFPKGDTFSYTFAGQPWHNQNWLTHVVQYWAYSHIAPDAVVWITWLMAASIAVFGLFGSYWRTGTALGAVLAGTAVALGCRDFVSARPATSGFFCMGAMWAMVCAVDGQRGRTRWWPIALLLPILLVWGGMHGSFTFGYAMLGLYLALWAVMRQLRPRSVTPTFAQVAAIAGVMVVAVVVTVAFGPLGIENFTHGEKVAGSAVFRRVSEWTPPYRDAAFPPAWRFWWILGAAIVCLIGATLVRALQPSASGRRAPEEPTSAHLHVGPFDVLATLIGLAMALWARRFTPIFVIFGAPVVLSAVLLLTRPLPATWKRRIALAVVTLSWPAAVALAWTTYTSGWNDLVGTYAGDPHDGLLERVTQSDTGVQDALAYLKNNDVHVNLFIEWTQAGDAMFRAPGVKVFMDGRSQQVYDEATFLTYDQLATRDQNADATMLLRMLDGFDEHGKATGKPRTDGVLIRRNQPLRLMRVLLRAPDWRVIYLSHRSALFLRVDSDAFRQVARLLREGREWRPETPDAEMSRGEVLTAMVPPEAEAALTAYRRAADGDAMLAEGAYARIAVLYRQVGRPDEALAYVRAQRERFQRPRPDVPETLRATLLARLKAWEAQLTAPAAPGG
jgi:hypothetical protein